MRSLRFPIASLMGVILFVGFGMAALRNASETWAGVIFLFTCGVLSLAIVGVVCRNGAERAWWLGFALFGWGYLALALWAYTNLPTMTLLDAIGSRLGINVQFAGGMGGMGGGMRMVSLWAGGIGWNVGGPPGQSLLEIAHCFWALAAAFLGGTLARILFGDSTALDERHNPPPRGVANTHSGRWSWPVAAGLSCAGVILILGLIVWRTSPDFWVGFAFLLTCGLLGTTLLGASSASSRSRPVWRGAAIFGVAYMTLAFCRSLDGETWPSLPTDHLLHAVRRWFPPIISGYPTSSKQTAAANAWIWQRLEKPVPMHFPEETPLEDVLTHIKAQTLDAAGNGLRIYVDPIGLQEAERTMTSVVAIDLEGVPLKTTLRLCLAQLGLSYCIRDGTVVITSDAMAMLPIYQDPFLIVGHCALALLAAASGALVGRVFCPIGEPGYAAP